MLIEDNEDKLSLYTSKSLVKSQQWRTRLHMRVYSEEVEGIGADDPTGGDSV